MALDPTDSSPAPAAAASPSPFALPKVLELPSASPPSLIAQGAEGRLYKSTHLHPERPCALKYRPTKPWRHPVLDQRLTRHRILAEARILARCRRDGLRVPGVYAVDEAAGWLMLEWIEGAPVRVRINERLGERRAGADGDVQEDAELKGLMRRIGTAVGRMHAIGVVHGDLTTSNMMLEPRRLGTAANGHADDNLDGEVVIIDLGLASGSTTEEDRAVDLYVLERAFGSTHPRAECIFSEVLDAYGGIFKQAPTVLKRLEEVRMRGRKRSMLG